MATLELTKGYVTIIDDEEYDRLSQWKWTAMITGQNIKRVYAYRRTDWDNGIRRYRKQILIHRFILNVPDGLDIDHIDHDTLNNQKSNLRIASRSNNLANNRRAKGQTGFRGVTIDYRDGAYIAQCRGYIGRFKTPVEAAIARDAVAIKEFGDFAKLNFPSQD